MSAAASEKAAEPADEHDAPAPRHPSVRSCICNDEQGVCENPPCNFDRQCPGLSQVLGGAVAPAPLAPTQPARGCERYRAERGYGVGHSVVVVGSRSG